jgi:hypothetical protein
MAGIPLAVFSAAGFIFVATHAAVLAYFWWKVAFRDIDMLPVLLRVLLPILLLSALLLTTAVFWIVRGWKLARRSVGSEIEAPGLALLIARGITTSDLVQGVARLVARVVPATFALSVTVVALCSRANYALL